MDARNLVRLVAGWVMPGIVTPSCPRSTPAVRFLTADRTAAKMDANGAAFPPELCLEGNMGWLLFGVGFIGVFVPVLPTTPLMLLALWCFSRSSDRFHAWLYTHKLFGPPLQQWHQFRVIPLTAKFIAILFMIGSLVYMFVFLTTPVWAKVLMSFSMAFASWYILTKPSFPPKK